MADLDEYAIFYLYTKEYDILLQFRSREQKHAHMWGTFGGHMQERETPEEGMIREAKEETGYDIKDYTYVETFDSPSGKPMHMFVAPFHGNFEDIQLKEGAGFAFVPPNYALTSLPISEGTRNSITLFKKHFGLD